MRNTKEVHSLHKIKDGFIETFCTSRAFYGFFLISLFTEAKKYTFLWRSFNSEYDKFQIEVWIVLGEK